MNVMNLNTGAISSLSSISATSASACGPSTVISNGSALQSVTFNEKQPLETVTLSIKDFAGRDPDEKAIKRIVVSAKDIRTVSANIVSIDGETDSYLVDNSNSMSPRNETVLHANGLRLSSSFDFTLTVSALSISNMGILVYTAKRTVRR